MSGHSRGRPSTETTTTPAVTQTTPATSLAPIEVEAPVTGHEGHDHGTFLSPEDGLFSGEQAPAAATAGRQQVEANGVQVSGDGVSSTALDVTERILATIANRPDIQENLGNANTRVVIIPAGSSMTDLPEFASLKDTQTFDGREWNDVRGSGGMQVGDEWLVAVPEENLVEHGTTSDPYQGDYSVTMHEIAHTIHSKGMTDEERTQLTALFAAQQAGGEFTGSYGGANEQEYFAQATNTYFGNNTIGENGAEWLADEDSDLFAFMQQIYGGANEGIERARDVRDTQAAEAVTERAEEEPPAPGDGG